MKEIGPSDVDSDSIDLSVVSHGGVASNAICDYLQKNGLRTRPDNYGLICHKQHPGNSLKIPILVIYGDFEGAIRSMDRRGYLTANATKMRFGMDLPEISLKRLIETQPRDPMGIIEFLDSFKNAKEKGIDNIEFLCYPYSNQDAVNKLQNLGFEIDFEGFSLRERKKKFGIVSRDVKEILSAYKDTVFT